MSKLFATTALAAMLAAAPAYAQTSTGEMNNADQTDDQGYDTTTGTSSGEAPVTGSAVEGEPMEEEGAVGSTDRVADEEGDDAVSDPVDGDDGMATVESEPGDTQAEETTPSTPTSPEGSSPSDQ